MFVRKLLTPLLIVRVALGFVAGCGSESPPGATVPDSGMAEQDAGISLDSGIDGGGGGTIMDAGPDAGTVNIDSGIEGADGSVNADGGSSPGDGCSIACDGGPPMDDGGPDGDAGPNRADGGLDGGLAPAAHTACEGSDAGPPVDGAITWGGGAAALVGKDPSQGWEALSADPECQQVTPRQVPHQLSWTAPVQCATDANGNPVCSCWSDGASSDYQGDVVVNTSSGDWFFDASGSGSHRMIQGSNESAGILPLEQGYLAISYTNNPRCYFERLLSREGSPGPAVPINSGGQISNPAGGYVETAQVDDPDLGHILWLRWVDDTMTPSGDWHSAMIWPLWGYSLDWTVRIDRQGNAFVLSFLYPESFDGPTDPSQWTFGARWMAVDGPLTDEFTPVAPIFTPQDPLGPVLFAGWGEMLPLREGGFAFHRDQADRSSGGTISPAGWYAFYPSGGVSAGLAPEWLAQFDGSVQLVASGAGYASTVREPATCSRTAMLIGPSGVPCFSVRLDDSGLCGGRTDVISTSGTLILQNICDFHWWPSLVSQSP